MAFIEKFLGRRVEIPEGRFYFPKPGLWAKAEGGSVVFGLTEPFLVLAGGFNELDWLVEEGQVVEAGEAVVFAITGKILYIDTPIAGVITFNVSVKEDRCLVADDPYGKGWLFGIKPGGSVEAAMSGALNAHEYLESIKGTEGFRNPEGIKGGVSGMCKAVYSGIKEQKLS